MDTWDIEIIEKDPEVQELRDEDNETLALFEDLLEELESERRAARQSASDFIKGEFWQRKVKEFAPSRKTYNEEAIRNLGVKIYEMEVDET